MRELIGCSRGVEGQHRPKWESWRKGATEEGRSKETGIFTDIGNSEREGSTPSFPDGTLLG